MPSKIVLDTSVLIDHFRKSNRENSFLSELIEEYDELLIPSIAQFEVLVGSNEGQHDFWDSLFSAVTILPFTEVDAIESARINSFLKKTNDLIGTLDLLIAVTALNEDLPIATTNPKHFSRVPNLKLVLPQ